MHAIIPFLMLGIGIDDMFVIVQCYNNVIKEGLHEGLKHEEVIGLTMKHAGVAITVTSVTNILVFAIGASTVLPALQSFCLYCAVGILAVYIYQGTIFTAAFSLDQRRIESRRNGCLPFIKHKNWEPNELSKRDIAQELFEKFGKLIMHPAAKVCVILFTIGWLSVGGWGLSMLRQEFNPIWFIPQESYLAGWFAANTEHFPKAGETVKINIAQIDYSSELPKIDNLVARLEQETAILSSVDSWYTKFKAYTEENDLVDGKHWFDVFQEDKMKFYRILTQFLFRYVNHSQPKFFNELIYFSPSGAKYRMHFNFVGDLVCGEAASEVLVKICLKSIFIFTICCSAFINRVDAQAVRWPIGVDPRYEQSQANCCRG
jgi:Niemann-Pick C1 protein